MQLFWFLIAQKKLVLTSDVLKEFIQKTIQVLHFTSVARY